MEQNNSSDYQQNAHGNPDKAEPIIQGEQALESERRGGNAGEPPQERRETLWNDFWRIPLKDRLIIWLTFLLLAAGCITLWVFKGQLDIMRDTLNEIKGGGDQTERLVITGLGQMAVADRAAKSVSIQAKAAQDQVHVLSRQMSLEQRAWISSQIHVTGPMDFDGGAAFLPLAIEMSNVGRSPAQSVVPLERLVVSPGGPLPKAKVIAICAELKSRQPSDANGWILFPGQTATSRIQGAGLGIKDVENGTANRFFPGKLGFALVTCVDYTMTFDPLKHHQTIQTYAVSFPDSTTGRYMGVVEPKGKHAVSLYLQPDSYVD